MEWNGGMATNVWRRYGGTMGKSGKCFDVFVIRFRIMGFIGELFSGGIVYNNMSDKLYVSSTALISGKRYLIEYPQSSVAPSTFTLDIRSTPNNLSKYIFTNIIDSADVREFNLDTLSKLKFIEVTEGGKKSRRRQRKSKRKSGSRRQRKSMRRR